MRRHGFTVLGRTVSEAYHRTNVLVSEVKRNIIAETLAARARHDARIPEHRRNAMDVRAGRQGRLSVAGSRQAGGRVMRLALRALALALLLASGLAQAEQWPNRPIKLIVPFPAGGGTDLVGRAIAKALGDATGQPVVVDNRAGAGGTIGSDAVARAAADGYTLGVATSSTHPTSVVLMKAVPYDPLKSFAPVTMIGKTAYVLVAAPSLPASSMAEFIAYAKANPGKLNFASVGVSTLGYLVTQQMMIDAGIELAHVPYKGSAQAYPALINGDVAVLFDNPAASAALVKSGRLKVLGATMKTSLMPSAPVFADIGLKNLDTRSGTAWSRRPARRRRSSIASRRSWPHTCARPTASRHSRFPGSSRSAIRPSSSAPRSPTTWRAPSGSPTSSASSPNRGSRATAAAANVSEASTGTALDHIVVNVRTAMDDAVALFGDLGFSLTARGYHSLGSINHLAVFGSDYLELVGVEAGRQPVRREIADGPAGLDGLVFATADARALQRRLAGLGVPVGAPSDFSRPVRIGGVERLAEFTTVRIAPEYLSGGRIYFCEHKHRELVWRREWQAHPNSATALARLTIVVADPAEEARRYATLVGGVHRRVDDEEGEVRLGSFSIVLCSRERYRSRYGEFGASAGREAAPVASEARAAFMGAVAVRTSSLARAASCVARAHELRGVVCERSARAVVVSARSAYDAVIEFV